MPDAVGDDAIASTGLVVAAGSLLFVPALLVWYRYSERIASDGGLYEFVHQAAGPRWATIQACFWIVSYFLYLPSTITQVVYDIVPVAFPGVEPYRAWLQILLPVAIILGLVLVERGVLVTLGLVAVVQILVVIVLGFAILSHAGSVSSSLGTHSSGLQLPRGAANVALLFTCASLPLFLGGEVEGGSRTIRRTLVISVAAVAGILLFAAIGLNQFAQSQIALLETPGYTVAEIVSGHRLAVIVIAVAAASVVSVIVAEYVALTRVVRAVTGIDLHRGALAIGGLFLLGAALALIDPDEVYEHALTGSLVALYISQAMVFAVYPMYARKQGRRSPTDVGIAVIATGLMVFGLYVAVTQAVVRGRARLLGDGSTRRWICDFRGGKDRPRPPEGGRYRPLARLLLRHPRVRAAGADGAGAAFVSAGGYHHHIGLNTWERAAAHRLHGAPPASSTPPCSTPPGASLRSPSPGCGMPTGR